MQAEVVGRTAVCTAPSTVVRVARRESIDHTLQMVCHMAADACSQPSALMLVADRNGHTTVVHHGRVEADLVRSLMFRPGMYGLDLGGSELDGGAPVVVDDLAADRSVLCWPIVGSGGRRVGVLSVPITRNEELTGDPGSLLGPMARVAGAAIDQHEAEQAMVELVVADRRQIAQRLYRESGEAITVASLALQRAAPGAGPESSVGAQAARRVVAEAMEATCRLAFDLYPTELDANGLAPAIESWVQEAFEPAGVTWRVEDRLRLEAEPATALLVYRLAQDLLGNVAAYSGLGSVSVRLTSSEQAITVRIVHDGDAVVDDADPQSGFRLGFPALQHLVEALHGRLRTSRGPGTGGTVELSLPVGIR